MVEKQMQVDAERLIRTMDQAAELTKQGKFFFNLGQDNQGSIGFFYIGLAGGTRGNNPYLNVYAYYWYLNNEVFNKGGRNLLEKGGPLTKDQIAHIRTRIIEINEALEGRLKEDQGLFLSKLRQMVARDYPQSRELRAVVQSMDVDEVKETGRLWMAMDMKPSAAREKDRELVRRFFKKPAEFGPLAELYQQRLMTFVMDTDGEIARKAAALKPEERARILFTDSEKREIDRWIQKGAAIRDETYAKLMGVVRGTAAYQFLDSQLELRPTRIMMAQMQFMNVGEAGDTYHHADPLEWERVEKNIGWANRSAGIPVRRR